MIPSGWTPPTSWPITRRNPAKSHQGCADRATLALNFTTTRTNVAVPRNTNTGTLQPITINGKWDFNSIVYVTDPLPVPMSSLETSGAIPRSVRPVMPANIAIRGLNNSFIRKSTNLPNVTIYKTPVIVQEVHSAHLLMLNKKPWAWKVRLPLP